MPVPCVVSMEAALVFSSVCASNRVWYVGLLERSPMMLNSGIGKESTMVETGSILVVMLLLLAVCAGSSITIDKHNPINDRES